MTATAPYSVFSTSQYSTSASHPKPHLSLASDNATWPRQARRIRLTQRQREVLALLCEGLPNKLICRRLDISPGTVKAHISSILREIGVASRLQAVVAARRNGLLDADVDASEPALQPALVGGCDANERRARQ